MIIIRMAKSEDIASIEELERECFGVHAWSYDGIMDAFLQYNYRFMVAVNLTELGEQIVGYMGMYLVVSEANVTNICVTKDFRDQGIGKKLLMSMIDLAKKSSCIAMTLEVRVSNAPAIKLYEACDFQSSGTRKNFYEDPKEDAYIMWCHFA